MTKRADPRRLRGAMNYTAAELALVLEVSVGTIRTWIKQGLRTLRNSRPTLILGSDAKEFLSDRKQSRRKPLEPDQVYCFTCKDARNFFDGMVQLDRPPGKPARIIGFCACCEGPCSRVVGAKQIPHLSRFFKVSFSKAKTP